ncbi:hypothetical protein HC823_00635 [Candidatus Gracilibacteria bacterium]|nr:hypothetical protein [Candidatus Gracilibacteria bacterium]
MNEQLTQQDILLYSQEAKINLIPSYISGEFVKQINQIIQTENPKSIGDFVRAKLQEKYPVFNFSLKKYESGKQNHLTISLNPLKTKVFHTLKRTKMQLQLRKCGKTLRPEKAFLPRSMQPVTLPKTPLIPLKNEPLENRSRGKIITIEFVKDALQEIQIYPPEQEIENQLHTIIKNVQKVIDIDPYETPKSALQFLARFE